MAGLQDYWKKSPRELEKVILGKGDAQIYDFAHFLTTLAC